MSRLVTLFTGQWADIPSEDMCRKTAEFGYDGIELACWGDHFEVDKAMADDDYCSEKRAQLERHGLQCEAISAHLVGQAACDNIDEQHKSILPAYIWGDGDPAGVNERAIEELKQTARAAQRFGVPFVHAFDASCFANLLEQGGQRVRCLESVFCVFRQCGIRLLVRQSDEGFPAILRPFVSRGAFDISLQVSGNTLHSDSIGMIRDGCVQHIQLAKQSDVCLTQLLNQFDCCGFEGPVCLDQSTRLNWKLTERPVSRRAAVAILGGTAISISLPTVLAASIQARFCAFIRCHDRRIHVRIEEDTRDTRHLIVKGYQELECGSWSDAEELIQCILTSICKIENMSIDELGDQFLID